jgi:4-coumarate--CoA ligase
MTFHERRDSLLLPSIVFSLARIVRQKGTINLRLHGTPRAQIIRNIHTFTQPVCMPSTIYTSPSPTLQLPSESLWTFIFHTTRHDPNLPAFIEATTGRVLSRADLRNLSLEFAHGIRTHLPQGSRLFRGDTAMIFSPNSFAWPIALFGLLAGGVRSTLANSAYTPTELAFQYNDSRARVVFSHPDLVPTVFSMFKHIGLSEDEARRRLVVLDLDGRGAEIAREVGVLGLADLLGHGSLSEEEKVVGSQADESQLLCYSSGTTGKPKGVEVCGFVMVLSWLMWLQTTHRNLTSILPMTKAIHAPLLPRRDVALGVLPYYHIYGTRHHCHVTCMFANTPQRRRNARVISPLLWFPCGHFAQIRS